jgi:S1-C subfamily serine protease
MTNFRSSRPNEAPTPGWIGLVQRWLLPAVALGALGLVLADRFWLPGRALVPDARPRFVVPRGDLAEDERSIVELFEQASPSAVYVDTSSQPLLSGGLGVEGTGSGFVWDFDGHVVTNAHVVADATSCVVVLADGSSWGAVVIGSAPEVDLAVLRIDAPASRLRPVPVGTSSDLRVGQTVFAIGNPYGFDQTLTRGIVSGLDRTIRDESGRRFHGLIQTDAAINPGNSGGPLLDSAGRLIGVNAAIVSPSGSSAGIGFAIPVDLVNRMVPEILRRGDVPRPGLGVLLLSESEKRMYGLNLEGAVIGSILEGSAAERAGLRPVWSNGQRWLPGDVIVGVDDVDVRSRTDLQDALMKYIVGDRVQLRVLRDQREVALDVELGSLDVGPGRP